MSKDMAPVSRFPLPELDELPDDIRERIVTVGEEADYRFLDDHGFDREDAWDIAAIAAFFAMSNQLANALGLRANEQFYTLGRS